MTSTLSCEALREDILSLLYDDGEPTERARARDHLAQCVPCRMEYGDLKGLRKTLASWNLPEAELTPRTVRTAPRWLPVVLTAAAGLIVGIGVGPAGRGLLASRSESPAPANVAAQAAQPASDPKAQFVSFDQLQAALKNQESRYLAEIAELRRAITTSQPVVTRASSDPTPDTFERLLRASEERQARAFEARLAGLRNENELQRQYDMAQVAAGLAYIDSRTGADAARTSELMKNLVRVTAKPQDR